MNYLAACFLAYLEDEELTFDIFMALIVHKRLLPLFHNGVPEYHLRNFILQLRDGIVVCLVIVLISAMTLPTMARIQWRANANTPS